MAAKVAVNVKRGNPKQITIRGAVNPISIEGIQANTSWYQPTKSVIRTIAYISLTLSDFYTSAVLCHVAKGEQF